MRIEVFTALTIPLMGFWGFKPYSLVGGYETTQRFGRPYCLHLQGGIELRWDSDELCKRKWR